MAAGDPHEFTPIHIFRLRCPDWDIGVLDAYSGVGGCAQAAV